MSKISKLALKRKEAGMTAKQLAAASGISLRTIQHYELLEMDINKASVTKVYALAQALNCDMTDLFDVHEVQE